MDNSESLSFSDVELNAFFNQLFPCGFAGADVLAEIAPEGWERLPLLACFHPSPEQVFKERMHMHRNIEEFVRDRGKKGSHQPKRTPGPEPTLEDIRAKWKDEPVNAENEVTELVGRCLWDIFSDNHEVMAVDGRLADIGSFRGASAFLDSYLSRKLEEVTSEDGDYMRFYMGTMWLYGRTDLRAVYSMIFRRLKSLGADWAYHFPELHCVDLTPLRQELESSIPYSPSEAWMAQREDEQRQAEVEKMRAELTEMSAQSRKEAMDRLPPTTVRAYQQVYGRNPRGWPP